MVNVREAIPSDLPTLLEYVDFFMSGTKYNSFESNKDNIRNTLVECIHNPSFVLLVGVNEKEEIAGVIAAHVSEMWFCKNKQAVDIFVYIHKELSTFGLFKQMIASYVVWAKNKGADLISLGISTGLNEKRVEKLYNLCGFRTIGTLHDYGV